MTGKGKGDGKGEFHPKVKVTGKGDPSQGKGGIGCLIGNSGDELRICSRVHLPDALARLLVCHTHSV